jgi:hypothetical protein
MFAEIDERGEKWPGRAVGVAACPSECTGFVEEKDGRLRRV